LGDGASVRGILRSWPGGWRRASVMPDRHYAVEQSVPKPSRPTVQNGFIESLNGRLRDECLNIEIFFDLDDARTKIERWRTTTTPTGRTARLAIAHPKNSPTRYSVGPSPLSQSQKVRPKIEMRLPGASGDCNRKLAAFNTPPEATSGGGLALARRLPLSSRVADSAGAAVSARIEMVTRSTAARACQVPDHRPSRSDARISGASPLENDAETVPAITGCAQSFTTLTSIGVGNPVVVWKDDPSVVASRANAMACSRRRRAIACLPRSLLQRSPAGGPPVARSRPSI